VKHALLTRIWSGLKTVRSKSKIIRKKGPLHVLIKVKSYGRHSPKAPILLLGNYRTVSKRKWGPAGKDAEKPLEGSRGVGKTGTNEKLTFPPRITLLAIEAGSSWESEEKRGCPRGIFRSRQVVKGIEGAKTCYGE